MIGLREVDPAAVAVVGGKGANLGALARLPDVRVPDGFCVSTAAYARSLATAPELADLLDRLSAVKANDRAAIGALAGAIRAIVEGLAVPADVQAEVLRRLQDHGLDEAFAVRSSATAEDQPEASFAGQSDSYLNVVGASAVLEHIPRCWASLFTDRAVAYRARQGLDPRRVRMAVVVQKMLRPGAAGVMFTADPLTANRRLVSIEAGPGPADALVSGRVEPAGWTLCGEHIVARRPAHADRATPTEAQLLELARLGRHIEAHFGEPQDIEWCLVDDDFHVVQTRPITTVYPLPQGAPPGFRVFVSVGHQQMMTDPMRPLGLSLFQATALRPMYAAGGRLFVDITKELGSPAGRRAILGGLGRSDPLIADALNTLLERGDLGESAPGEGPAAPPPDAPALAEVDESSVTDAIARSREAVERLKHEIRGQSGATLVDFILEDVERLKRSLTEPRSVAALMAGINATLWLDERMQTWLGEKGTADGLSHSLSNNVTAEMGRALLDVADAIRPHPEVVAYLRRARDEDFLEGLRPLPGGAEAHEALCPYLDRYGMRCAGEIDVTRTRWSEAPTTLVSLLLGHVENAAPGAGRRKFEQGLRESAERERVLLERLAHLPEGERKVEETGRMIRRLRLFSGYREHPKYEIVCRYFVYKRALRDEARALVQAGVLDDPTDLDFLTLPELREVLRTRTLDHGLVERRRAEHERHRRLKPPRVLTSDGEIVAGAYRRGGLPAGALPGLAVSAGVVEGRARVLADLAGAELAQGDILVTRFTDPSWTPAFLSVAALVTEVGGLMTHGAVIAREFGLPAVVGVEDATRRIEDGERIRVHGTEGYVERLGRGPAGE